MVHRTHGSRCRVWIFRKFKKTKSHSFWMIVSNFIFQIFVAFHIDSTHSFWILNWKRFYSIWLSKNLNFERNCSSRAAYKTKVYCKFFLFIPSRSSVLSSVFQKIVVAVCLQMQWLSQLCKFKKLPQNSTLSQVNFTTLLSLWIYHY